MNIDKQLYPHLIELGLEHWANILPSQLNNSMGADKHGNYLRWTEIIETLPTIEGSIYDLNRDAICVESKNINFDQQNQIKHQLKKLMPWRKGPYDIYGIHIDTEWRSDLKWNRLKDHIQPLHNRVVLDVGCGSGYHGWRMLGAGARLVLGIDPTLLFVMQFQAIKHFIGNLPFYVLPLGIEAVPENLQVFDTVFSMGVLYHRRSPLDHLIQLRQCLKSGGELVLETLIVDGNEQTILMPRERYAKMRNVWFIPSIDAVKLWLHRCGFSNIKLIDTCKTTPEEQRRTEWMEYESLVDFLDTKNPSLTVEGHPAPRRAVFTATAP